MNANDAAAWRHRQLEVDDVAIHAVEGGTDTQPTVMFLHGWPTCWQSFERVMAALAAHAHVVAIDLPGIGGSPTLPAASDKRTLAGYVRGAIAQLGLRHTTLVGHDVGGMIVYAFLHAWPGVLERAVIMNTAVPGVAPWHEVERNPHIWHFAFHAVPQLPEALVAGHQAEYFAFFFDSLSARPEGVDSQARNVYAAAYAQPQALHAGFEWYRAFGQDAQHNRDARGHQVETPVLYLRGEAERGIELRRYVDGLREGGLAHVHGGLVPASGHFAPDEQPEAVAAALRAFMAET